MPSTVTIPIRPSLPGEPVWEVVDLFPEQGRWTQNDYLRIETNRLVEFTDGRLEVLPMPTFLHQQILSYLFLVLTRLKIQGQHGVAVPPVFRVKLREDLWREPDITYMLPQNRHLIKDAWWDYADLVIEIVSPDNPPRDYIEKRADYAAAGIPEYWVVDPMTSTVTVLALDGAVYRDAQIARAGDVAVSPSVAGFQVNVSDMFAAARA